jgi:hypothetical protein
MVRTETGSAAQTGDRGYVRSFNRFEYKYLLRQEDLAAFAQELAPFVRADDYSGEHGYPVHSVYWDSSDLIFFWEKIDGEKFRRKLRLRTYQGGGGAFIEIKQRTDRTVQKRRVLWPLGRVRAVFDAGHLDLEALTEQESRERVFAEALFLCRHYQLGPRMAVRYRRRAWFGLHERDLRITYDTRLRYDPRELDPARPFETGKALLEPGLGVLEIKFDDRVPLWLTRLVARHGLQVVRISKYCTAIDREIFGGRFT